MLEGHNHCLNSFSCTTGFYEALKQKEDVGMVLFGYVHEEEAGYAQDFYFLVLLAACYGFWSEWCFLHVNVY
ncbi:hypothetical protein SUGI_0270520 [Cryptomeria japonica]|nr:hypothetical protein SUGI_0270520 [Cryptomeria japonica]